MNNYVEVMRRILELSESIGETFVYVREKVPVTHLESLYGIIYQAIEGIHHIQLVMVPFSETLLPNRIEDLTVELNRGLHLLVSACEEKAPVMAYAALEDQLITAYANWQNELKSQFQPYMLS